MLTNISFHLYFNLNFFHPSLSWNFCRTTQAVANGWRGKNNVVNWHLAYNPILTQWSPDVDWIHHSVYAYAAMPPSVIICPAVPTSIHGAPGGSPWPPREPTDWLISLDVCLSLCSCCYVHPQVESRTRWLGVMTNFLVSRQASKPGGLCTSADTRTTGIPYALCVNEVHTRGSGKPPARPGKTE